MANIPFNLLASGEQHIPPLIMLMAAAFTAAWVLGLITQAFKLSPIVGYLLAGIVIGPYSPGFVADINLAPQLSEIGVILLMFGVGLHFHLKDLLAVKHVAIPGAIGQSVIATVLGALLALTVGWSFNSGLVLGMALAVASTVVLMRVLMDNKVLDTTHGHVAVGWLIVEDVLTVIVLVLIPAMGSKSGGESHGGVLLTLAIALLKLAALVTILLVAGARVIPWIMVKVARLRSRELFTLTVLVMAIAVAAASAYFFGASMALGAFLAGMVVGQSPVSHQAAADALPLRDAFAVLFFSAVGMLFDPMFVVHHPFLLAGGLAIVLIGKPLAAMLVVAVIGYPPRTALTVALGLAQIGEFSFILSELGKQNGLLNDDAHNLLVACAIVSITLNPILFRSINRFETLLKGWPKAWGFMNRNTQRIEREMNEKAGQAIEESDKPLAVIIGYGPVGKAVDSILKKSGRETVIVDLNLDTVQALQAAGRKALYGDAYNIEIMHQALPRATHLIIALPHSINRNPLIAAAKLINPEIKIFVRARYLAEQEELMQVGADAACFEEAEAAVGLAKLVLLDQGANAQKVSDEVATIRERFTTALDKP